MKLLLSLALVIGIQSVGAQIYVDEISMSQDAATRVVTIEYKLKKLQSEATQAIVTLDFQVSDGNGNWVSIGGEHYRGIGGDVNHVLAINDEVKTIRWTPDTDWAGHDLAANSLRVELTPWSVNNPPPYWAIDFSSQSRHTYYPNVESLPGGIESDRWRMTEMLMRKIPAKNAVFTQGSPETEVGRSTDENRETPHTVSFTHDYYMGVFELTQMQSMFGSTIPGSGWFKASFTNRLHWATRPAETLDFADRMHLNTDPTSDDFDVVHSCDAYRIMGGLRTGSALGNRLDLPTEAQWEFACRAGSTNALYNGTEITALSSRDDNLRLLARNKWTVQRQSADFSCTTENGTARVGSYLPNAWGLYDMLGNVAEMCLDWTPYKPTYAWMTADTNYDPVGYPESSNYRITRGGNYTLGNSGCRSAARDCRQVWSPDSTVGSRLSYTLQEDDEVCAEDYAVLATALSTTGARKSVCLSASRQLTIGPDPLTLILR